MIEGSPFFASNNNEANGAVGFPEMWRRVAWTDRWEQWILEDILIGGSKFYNIRFLLDNKYWYTNMQTNRDYNF